jgi:peptidoglycan/LPS O-acetylase OafA/YrhL
MFRYPRKLTATMLQHVALGSDLRAIASASIAPIVSSLPWPDRTTSPKLARASPTAWLDGLRGFASLFVSIYHVRSGYTNDVHVGYGKGGGNHSILQLPFIRLIFAGPAMVALFFVISGFSLSWGPFNDIQAGDTDKCLNRIRSSVFRRFFRLYLPTFASTFLALLCISLGLYSKGTQMDMRTAWKERQPKYYSNFIDQFRDWTWNTLLFCNVWSTAPDRHVYYSPSWSIQVEFKCSILLYIFLVGISKLRFTPRFVALIVSIIYCHWTRSHHLWTFFIGATLAQLTAYKVAHGTWEGGYPPEHSRVQNWLRSGVLVSGLYLLSFPDWSGLSNVPL